jgi:pyridoxal 5'-phosphate synthase / NAD(P)H-hydrate epimerase
VQGQAHYLGGRFVPPEITDQYNLVLPAYPGTAMCVKLHDTSASAKSTDVARMRTDDSHISGGLTESSILKVPC